MGESYGDGCCGGRGGMISVTTTAKAGTIGASKAARVMGTEVALAQERWIPGLTTDGSKGGHLGLPPEVLEQLFFCTQCYPYYFTF